MRLEQLKYFVEVARCGSITKASKKLYLSQPALSAALNALERELGAPLLDRSPQGVTPTELGKRILEDSGVILELTEGWRQLAAPLGQAPSVCHIMALPPDCSFLMKLLVPRLMEEYPRLSVLLHEATTQQVLSSMRKGTADIYISCYTPEEENKTLSAAEEAGYQTVTLLRDRLEIFLSVHNPLARRGFLTPEDCPRLTLARYLDHNDQVSRRFSSHFSSASQIWASNLDNILQLIAQDKAVAYYPVRINAVSQYVTDEKIRSIPIQGESFPTTHFAAFSPELSLDSPEFHIVEAIQECYAMLAD